MADIQYNQAAEAALLQDVGWRVLEITVGETFTVAEALVPVKSAHATYSGGPRPGRLKASMHTSFGEDPDGQYGDVRALWYGMFADLGPMPGRRARQIRKPMAFLPTALFMAVDGTRY
jgi:hypothetical protein